MAHALLGPSSAARWIACPPSVRLCEQFEDVESEYAKEGSLAHEIAELKVRKLIDPGLTSRKFTAAMKKLKDKELYQEEMQGYTDEYVEFIQEQMYSYETTPHISVEQKVDFSQYVPGGFGTADCILISQNVLHVIDFKYGKGVPVSAEHNPQLMLYALGAYDAYSCLYSIDTVRISIVQPRLQADGDMWETSIRELLEFGEKVRVQADLAISREGRFNPGESQCRFCRAKTQCRARAEKNVQLAFFTEKKPPLIRLEEVGAFLKKGTDVAKWLKDLQDYALAECLAGKQVPGWKAVEGRGSRDWTDQEAAFQTLESAGTPKAMLYETLPLSLAKIEKLVGKKAFEKEVGSYVKKNPGKPTLVPESDKRQAITNVVSAKEAFKG